MGQRSEELALLRDIPIEKPDIEVFSQTKEVPFVLLFRDFAAEDITESKDRATARGG
jgi:hypothetical protein